MDGRKKDRKNKKQEIKGCVNEEVEKESKGERKK